MKRFLLVVACLVCAVGFAGPANAVVLDADDVIGTIIDGVPSGDSQELLYVTTLINAYNAGSPTTGAIVDAGPPALNEAWAIYNVGDFGTLPDLTSAFKIDSNPFSGGGDIDLTGTSYIYLYAKYGGGADDAYAVLFWLDSYTSLEGINFVPAGIDQKGLSHVTLWNPTQVPEPGTLMLLGFGLAGVGTLRRFLKR